MGRVLPVSRARTVVATIAAALLVISFASVAILFNRSQAGVGAAPGCPSLSGKVASSLVGAHFSVSSSTATYVFDSLVNRSPSNGVPGLIEYCVFPASDPTNVTATALGANSDPFQANTGSGEFSFSRGGGNPSNIPLDGNSHVMGTAVWSGAVPSSQTFLLHINDAAECDNLYGGNPGTCWVLPSDGNTPTPTPGPTATATATPGPTATPDPTATPGGSATPTPLPTPLPTPKGTTPPGK